MCARIFTPIMMRKTFKRTARSTNKWLRFSRNASTYIIFYLFLSFILLIFFISFWSCKWFSHLILFLSLLCRWSGQILFHYRLIVASNSVHLWLAHCTTEKVPGQMSKHHWSPTEQKKNYRQTHRNELLFLTNVSRVICRCRRIRTVEHMTTWPDDVDALAFTRQATTATTMHMYLLFECAFSFTFVVYNWRVLTR